MSDNARDDVTGELLDVVRTFVRKEVVPYASRYDLEDEYPADIVAGMKELGLFGITVPEKYDGLGLDILTYARVVEELAYGWMSVSGFLNTHFMGCWLIATYGTDDQKRRFLPRMATGETRAAYSLSEPDAGSDVAAIRTRARRDGARYVVDGTKMWLTNGLHAGLVVTLVRTSDPEAGPPTHRGMSVLLVEKQPGAERDGGITVSRKIHKLGYRGIETVELVFSDHLVPAENLLGGPEAEGQGFKQMMSAVELGRMAKLFASETCWEVTQEALRIHGGNGYSSDYPIERLYRDAPLMIVGDGTSEIQKVVIARRLLEEYAIP